MSGYWVCCGSGEAADNCGRRIAIYQDCCLADCPEGESECGVQCVYTGYCRRTGCQARDCGQSKVYCVYAWCATETC